MPIQCDAHELRKDIADRGRNRAIYTDAHTDQEQTRKRIAQPIDASRRNHDSASETMLP